MMEKKFSEMCSGGDMELELECSRVLLSSQRLKRRVITLLDITSLYGFYVDDTKEATIIFNSSLNLLGGGSKITSLKLSIDFLVYSTYIFCLFLWIVLRGQLLKKSSYFCIYFQHRYMFIHIESLFQWVHLR